MRIAMIGPFGLHPKGTMRVRALPLARELAARGHAVRVVMPPWHTPDEDPQRWVEAGVEMEYVRLVPSLFPAVYPIVTLRLVRRALDWRPDVVHCFKPKGYAGLAAWVLWQLRRMRPRRVRLVMDEDDWEGAGGWNDLEPYPHLARAFFQWQERWGLRHNDAVTVASRTLEGLAWSLGVPRSRVYYLPNGVDSARHGDGERVRAAHGLDRAPVVLLYTRLFEYDVGRVVSAFGRVLEQAPAARLLVVGEGLFAEDDARFDRLVLEKGLGHAVVRAGWVPQQQLPDYFAASDVALYPLDDTLVNRAKCSVKLVDLLASGVPVVADAVGQNTEYIEHGRSGLLVSAGDVDAMATETTRLLGDEALCASLSASAAKRMGERFSWRVLVKRALAAYEGTGGEG